MPTPRISFNQSRPYTPWRVYFRSKSYWFPTEADAKKKKDELAEGRGRFSKREIDQYAYCRELLRGVPVLRAVRFYLEHNAARLRNAMRTVAEMTADFTSRLRGRKKYLQEARRNVRLLVAHRDRHEPQHADGRHQRDEGIREMDRQNRKQLATGPAATPAKMAVA